MNNRDGGGGTMIISASPICASRHGSIPFALRYDVRPSAMSLAGMAGPCAPTVSMGAAQFQGCQNNTGTVNFIPPESTGGNSPGASS